MSVLSVRHIQQPRPPQWDIYVHLGEILSVPDRRIRSDMIIRPISGEDPEREGMHGCGPEIDYDMISIDNDEQSLSC